MARRRVLIVEDNQEFARLMRLNLEAGDAYEVRCECESSRVPAAVQEFRPEVILMDVRLPGRSGLDLALDIHAQPATKAVPIIFLTGTISQEEVQAHHGIIDGYPCLAKPVTPDELCACIEQQFNG